MVMEKRGEEMAKIGCVDLKEETSPKEKSLLNIELCLKVEELIKSYKLESLEDWVCIFDHMTYQRCLISTKICFIVMDLELPQPEIEQMLHHVEFYKLATRTLTENEFRVVYHLSSVDYHFREPLREHNKQCPVFFVKGYEGMVRSISFYQENKVDDEYVIEFNKWLVYMIERHHEIRTYFDFCNGCEHNTVEKCKFWENVSQSLQSTLSLSNEGDCADAIRKYLAGLEIACKIPTSLTDLGGRQYVKQGVIVK